MKKQFFEKYSDEKMKSIRILTTGNTGMSLFQSIGRNIRETRESRSMKKIKNIFQ